MNPDLLYTQINSVVCVQVVLYISPAKCTVRTQRTREWFLSCVDAQVLVKIGFIPCLIWAMGARERLHSCMCSAVLYKVATIYSTVITLCTLIQSWQFSAVGEAILNSHRSSTACHFTGIIQQHLQEMWVLIIKKKCRSPVEWMVEEEMQCYFFFFITLILWFTN